MNILPDLVAHADWSKDPKKRWVAVAIRQHDGIYQARAPESVKDARLLLGSLRDTCQPMGTILVGFDFPIGIPVVYARRCGINNFLALLPQLGQGEWHDFFNPAETADQINLYRPFYPLKPGGSRRTYLTERLLGHDNFDDLRRLCEKGYDGRRAACPLFWTLGGQQVGKAAICGWKEVIQPAMKNDRAHSLVWPFDGPLSGLLSQPGSTILSETYPAEFYPHLDIDLSGKQAHAKASRQPSSGKRSPQSRRENADVLRTWSQDNGVRLTRDLEEQIQAGFSPNEKGEDPFDALIGLFGMLNILLGKREWEDSLPDEQTRIEGWILGQDCSLSAR